MVKRVIAVLVLIFSFTLVSADRARAGWLLDAANELWFNQGMVLGIENKGLGTANKPETVGKTEDDFVPPGQAKQVEIQSQGNSLKVKFLNEAGEEVSESTDSGEFDIEDDEDEDTTQIRSQGNAAFVIRNKIAAQTHFPLMVNLETNELMVTTPKGTKIVTVLPDKAVENMLAANVLDQLGGKGGLLWLESQATPSATPVATDSGELEATDSGEMEATESGEPEIESVVTTATVTMTIDEEGSLVYEIEGFKEEKFLGLFDVLLQRVVIVSAETGELVDISQDLMTQILDLLSF